jgi:histone H3
MARTKNATRHSTGKFRPVVQLAAKKAAARSQQTVRRVYRRPSGAKALQEIKQLQKKTNLLLRRAPFYRLVREITNDYKSDVKFQRSALEALQHAAEGYLVRLFESAFRCAIHCKRVTVNEKDIRLCMLFQTAQYNSYDSKGVVQANQLSVADIEKIKDRSLKAKKARKKKLNESSTAATQRY